MGNIESPLQCEQKPQPPHNTEVIVSTAPLVIHNQISYDSYKNKPNNTFKSNSRPHMQ